MVTITDILKPQHLDLNLGPVSQHAAVQQLAGLLRGDPRVLDWSQFFDGVRSRTPCIAETSEFDILIPHARTDSVNAMVMSAGRARSGEGADARVRYLFVIGVPQTLAADYLRVIGALARIFRNPDAEHELRAAQTPEAFLAHLHHREMEL